jgi:hypothetical protein
MADQYEDFLSELSKRSGASVEQSDLEALRGKNPEDVEAHKRALEAQYAQRGSNTPGQGSGSSAPTPQPVQAAPPAQTWNNSANMFPDWYRDQQQQQNDLMRQQIAQQQAAQAENKTRADALYGQLNARATQGLQVNANDPIIRGQVDAYAAQGERARRGYLSDIAERSGPLANIQGERRMAAERLGQGASAFQAELLGRELGSRRDEIAQALAMQGSMLSGDQNRNLQSQLAAMDQAIAEAGVGLQGRGLDLQRELGNRGLDLQRDLGGRGLDLQSRGQDLSQDQFLRELALREWDRGQYWDYNYAGL